MKNKISGRRDEEREELEPDVGRGGVNYRSQRLHDRETTLHKDQDREV